MITSSWALSKLNNVAFNNRSHENRTENMKKINRIFAHNYQPGGLSYVCFAFVRGRLFWFFIIMLLLFFSICKVPKHLDSKSSLRGLLPSQDQFITKAPSSTKIKAVEQLLLLPLFPKHPRSSINSKQLSDIFAFLFMMRMVRWCIRLTRLTPICDVIRYRLVQVWQNPKGYGCCCEPVTD